MLITLRRTQAELAKRGNAVVKAYFGNDRLEAVLVIVGVEQPQLLAAMGGVEGIVDVQHDPARHVTEAF